jgi:hypothetical protein
VVWCAAVLLALVGCAVVLLGMPWFMAWLGMVLP